MVDDMYWGKCPECPPTKDYTHIPENSDICISCMEEKFDHFEYEPETPGQSYTEDELRKMICRRGRLGATNYQEAVERLEEADVDADEIVEKLENNGGDDDG